jgi:XTP/dITP diphosphohydrolase
MIKLVFATQNQHKIREVQQLLGDDYQVVSLNDIGYTDRMEEPYPTLEANALAKALFVQHQFHLPCVADDTGLEVVALGGAPGVLSSRFAEEEGPFSSDQARFNTNIQKLLKYLGKKSNRKARFRTVVAFVAEQGEYIFEGICEGTILQSPRGHNGFGYDPVFQPLHRKKSFAEMSLEEKNKISHRAKAFNEWKTFLDKNRNLL